MNCNCVQIMNHTWKVFVSSVSCSYSAERVIDLCIVVQKGNRLWR